MSLCYCINRNKVSDGHSMKTYCIMFAAEVGVTSSQLMVLPS